MGALGRRKFRPGEPGTAVPAEWYNDVDEILRRLDVWNGHIERNGNFWTIVLDEEGLSGYLSNMFQVIRYSAREVIIRPGVWVRNQIWNGSTLPAIATWRTDPRDVITLGAVGATYTGNIYIYVLMKESLGTGGTTYSGSFTDLSPESGDWNSTSTFGNGLEYIFSSEKVPYGTAGSDGGGQYLPIAEVILESGEITQITQVHRGPRIDGSTLALGSTPDSASQYGFVPNISYSLSGGQFKPTLIVGEGNAYFPSAVNSAFLTSAQTSFGDTTLNAAATSYGRGEVWATVNPNDTQAQSTTPEKALVPDSLAIKLADDTQYTPTDWTGRGSGGQHLLGTYELNTFGGSNVFYVLGYTAQRSGTIIDYYTRPDAVDANLNAIDTAQGRGYSLHYADSTVPEHQGEMQVYRFNDTNYVDSSLNGDAVQDIDAKFEFLARVKDTTSGNVSVKYVKLNNLTVNTDSFVIDTANMDTSADWGGWIDSQLHSHEAHRFSYDDHDGDSVGGDTSDTYQLPARYIRHDGPATRNNMSGVIGDGSGNLSISPTPRKLHDEDGDTSIIWGDDTSSGNARTCYGQENEKSIDWHNRELYDNAGEISASWKDRQLYDDTNIASINWQDRICYDRFANLSMDYDNRQIWGDWGARNGDFDLADTADTGKVYKRRGISGVIDTENGISGGIVISETNLLTGTIVTDHIQNLIAQGF